MLINYCGYRNCDKSIFSERLQVLVQRRYIKIKRKRGVTMAESALENVKRTLARRRDNIKKGKTTEGARGYQYSKLSVQEEINELARIKNLDKTASTRIMDSGNVNIRCKKVSNLSGDNQRKSVSDELMFSVKAKRGASDPTYVKDIGKASYDRDEDMNDLTEANDRLNKAFPPEDPYDVIREYLNGNRAEFIAVDAVQTLASKIKKDPKEYVTYIKGRNYQEYDAFIKGWVEYFNKSRNEKIDPEVIKAMLYKESKMGKYGNESPNANWKLDVMQCLDPRNPPVYEFTNIDSKQGTIVYVYNREHKYVPLVELEYTPDKPSGKHVHKVAERLFKKQNKKYYYQYSDSTPFLSIGLGVYWYGYQLDRVKENKVIKIQEINQEWAKKGYDRKYIAAGVYNIGDIDRYIPDVKNLVEKAKKESDFDAIK